jgi:tRNA-splicing ligase RtcB
MGTSSYIVKGLGNPDSFMSCSHGAGRTMGRKEACRKLSVEECDKAMEGIVFGRWGRGRKGQPDLSEAPQAYKNIDEVIAAQSDLVEVVTKLRPLGVIKG